MSNSIDDSYQVSLHLTEGIQRRLKCEKLTDDRRRMPSDGKSSLCLWQGELIILKIFILLIEITAMIFPNISLYFLFFLKIQNCKRKTVLLIISSPFPVNYELLTHFNLDFFVCVFFFTYTSCNVHCSKDQINKIVVNHRIELQYYYKPLLDVYRSAAWKHATLFSVNESSIDICIPNPASGLMLGSDNKSVDRTKKFPWKVWMLNPV